MADGAGGGGDFHTRSPGCRDDRRAGVISARRRTPAPHACGQCRLLAPSSRSSRFRVCPQWAPSGPTVTSSESHATGTKRQILSTSRNRRFVPISPCRASGQTERPAQIVGAIRVKWSFGVIFCQLAKGGVQGPFPCPSTGSYRFVRFSVTAPIGGRIPLELRAESERSDSKGPFLRLQRPICATPKAQSGPGGGARRPGVSDRPKRMQRTKTYPIDHFVFDRPKRM